MNDFEYEEPIPNIFYERVSTDKQDMDRQRYMLDQFANHGGHPVLARFADPDVSASILMVRREGGGRMLKFIAGLGGKKFYLVTTELDRIGRDLVDAVGTCRRIWEAGGVPVFTAEGGPKERTPENEMYIGMRASAAQYERDKIRQRIRSKFEYKRSVGELCGTVPYGFNAVPTGATTSKGVAVREMTENLEEQAWILRMVQWRAEGTGFHTIAKMLNAGGCKTKTGKGIWQSGNVAKVLSNKTVQTWLAEHQRMAA